ncbi:PREDICTED: uncharacterized protein LOC105462212, partial [Wasmannia auropunctata]|uniref:uncharacterized protein LOC105462212 n=1 Tax=Wasmannia auropunctata TaxID=64793 RepID=UPI0005EF42D2
MSLDAESLLRGQEDLFGRIARAMENLKKSGAASITTGTIETRIKILDTHWAKFDATHDVLRGGHWKTISELEYIKSDLYGMTEETYAVQRAALLDSLEELRGKVLETSNLSTVREAEGSKRRTLPRIQLPSFSGKFDEWPAFKDLFRSIIHGDTSLSDVEKLHYLRSCLKEEAEQLVRNIPATAENYARVWRTLSEHYENKRLLVRACFSSFTALPKMKMEMLDLRTRREWETTISGTTEPPSYGELRTFLEGHMRTLEALHPGSSETNASGTKGGAAPRAARTHLAQKQVRTTKCSLCRKEHYILSCGEFQKKSPRERKEYAEANELCLNCFGKHRLSTCPSRKSCAACKQRHHSSIHDVCSTVKSEVGEASALHVRNEGNERDAVLLATARVAVTDRFGTLVPARALIDPGSEVSLAAESLLKRLRLPRAPASTVILGVGGQETGVSRGRVMLTVSSQTSDASIPVPALILPHITTYSGRMGPLKTMWPHVRDLPLADPDFGAADPIEILLGADVYPAIVEEGLRRGERGAPVAQRTSLGWILSGLVSGAAPPGPVVSLQCLTGEDLTSLVKTFWEQEEPSRVPLPLTEADRHCEEHFERTHRRLANGRYVVRLPIAPNLPSLADSRRPALSTLKSMERKFAADPEFRAMYTTFMAEYETLKHMSPAAPGQSRVCFLPHHGVVKKTGNT